MKFYRQVFLFNKPLFIAAAFVVAVFCAILFLVNLSQSFKIVTLVIIAGTIYLSFGSMFFSYLIYDVSDLYKYTWLKKYFRKDTICFNLFSGYSESGFMLKIAFKKYEIRQLDFFEPGIAVTSSIKKAKLLSRVIDNSFVHYNDWRNVEKADIILFMQSLHELRPAQQKISFLRQANQHLQSEGQIIIAEHLCDWKNFLIYGPGAFHFFGNKHWMKCIEQSGLILQETFFITPFVKIYVLKNIHE